MIFLLACSLFDTKDDTNVLNEITQADILIVVDNSTSMREESTNLALVGELSNKLLARNDLSTQIGIVTTTVDYSVGQTDGIDPGEAGLLVGPVIEVRDEQSGIELQRQLLCQATYWEMSSLASNMAYQCDSENPQLDASGEVTIEFLDCLCAGMDWESVSGSGNEEPLEAATLALCGASDTPPEPCDNPMTVFDEEALEDNLGFIRPDSKIHILLIGDEGDNSRRMVQGESDPQVYMDIFQQFDNPVHISTFGPNFDGVDFNCNSGGAVTWAVERLQNIASDSEGIYRPLEISDSNGGCTMNDFDLITADFVDNILPN